MRCLIIVFLLCVSVAQAEYAPLAVKRSSDHKVLRMDVEDTSRSRTIPIKVVLPEQSPAPVVIFSHGLGGTRETCSYLGDHWAGRGFAVVFVQHPGSDEAVWKDQPLLKRMIAMQQAASAKNYFLRVKDIPAVLDQLETWNQSKGHELAGKLDLKRVGMSGHSFGAVTTQALSGQSAGGRAFLTDTRIKAAISMSPSSPQRGGDPDKAFSTVQIPWLLMTGTKDVSPIGGQTLESRLEVYPSLPKTIAKYQLVLNDAEHSAFTERALPGDKERRNPNHHRAILAISTAFWEAYLLGDHEAADWLNGSGLKSVLEPQDSWQLNVPD